MRRELSLALAGAFLAGPWTRPGLVVSGSVVLRRRAEWLPALARQVLEVYPAPPLDAPRELAAVIATRQVPAVRGRPRSRPVVATRMLRNPWHLPVLHGLDDVGRLLRLDAGALEWFADGRHLARGVTATPLQHYRVGTRLAPSGAVRVLEAPKPRLKAVQRLLLARVLHRVPPHDAAHGFRPGRSVASFAAPHAGQAVVLRMDLEGFFASVSAGRVYGILRTAGYPEPVAHCLAGICTTVLPRSAWAQVPRPADELLEAHWRLGRRLAVPHLPQGAPTSPALANLAAHRLDVRLTALARSWGGAYTRYADDLALSGGRSWGRGTSRLVDAVAAIAASEGFRVNDRKTAVLPRAGRQVLGGLVVNERPHVGRAEVDRLRAVLHNCVRSGPSSQNREGVLDFRGHLTGRVAWVAQHDADRGARLRATLDAVDWSR
jgi:hypothetical protein